MSDQYNEAIGLLPGQYEDSTHLRDLIRCLFGDLHTHVVLEELEDLLQDLKTDLWLDVATGQQLDNLGKILGCTRSGMTDDQYRFRLWIQVGMNTCNGKADQIIVIADLLWGPDWIQILESNPVNTARCMYLCVRLAAGAIAPPADITDLLQHLAPGGVALWFTSALADAPFGFDDDTLGDHFDEVDAMHVIENDGGAFTELWPHAWEV